MAHFAKLSAAGVVLQVVVVNNAELIDETGNESEAKGIAFLTALFGHDKWAQCSYSASFRKFYPAIGFVYDAARDAFMPPQPFPSWTLDEQTLTWVPPIPAPEDGSGYLWNEEAQTWEVQNVTT